MRLKVAKSGSDVDVFAWSDTTLVFTASAVGVPVSGTYTLYLGGEAVLLDVGQRTVRAVGSRQLVGKVNDDGTYTMLIRADAFAMDPIGTVAFTYDWDWAELQSVLSGAHVEMAIRRVGTIVTCSTTIVARDGRIRRSIAIQTNAPTTPLSFGFTNEESMVDLLETERVTEIGKSGGSVGVGPGRPSAHAPRISAGVRSIVIEANRAGEITIVRPDGRVAQRISFAAGTTRSAPLEPGLYLVAGRRVMVP